MAKKSIVWTQTAQKQRREILAYWTKRNGSAKYAEKIIKITKKRVTTIAQNPNSGKSTDFPDIRVSAMGYFSILYKSLDDSIIIMSFWDNRQDPKKLFDLLNNKN